ncbi:hypothetical protein [Spiroplasma endosymbiont of Crioceris asparagi]|uniref:hypothetical protein n=1 Tax=Spiroplasma endosymbiont of Crioceris asparagi TaxID=3066286 RepID=UPI0030CA71ED
MGLFKRKNIENNKISYYQKEYLRGYLLHNENEIDIQVTCLKYLDEKIATILLNERFESQIAFRIQNAHAFNTIGLKEEIDVVFCDKNGKVISTYSKMPIQKVTGYYKNAWYIFVFASKTIDFLNIKVNDFLKIKM